MSRRKTTIQKTQTEDDGLDFNVGDIGIETPDFDTALFDILEDEVGEETRYIKPKVYATSSDFVMYDNAVKLARDIEITEGSRYDVVEDNGGTGSGNGSTIQSFTAASGRGSSMPFYDPFGGGPSGPAPF